VEAAANPLIDIALPGDGTDVAEALRSAILNGAIPPGTRLRQPEIARMFGISRTPVREALHKLNGWGLVDLVANHAATVRHLRPTHYANMFVVWAELEALAVELAIARNADLAAQVRDAIRDEWGIVDAVTNGDRLPSSAEETWISAQERFHDALLDAAGSPRLQETIRASTEVLRWQPIWRAVAARPFPLRMSVLRHEELVVLIRRRDSAEAARCMREHLAELEDAVVAWIERVPSETANVQVG
jgi:DNA-binding GntR family transcriptional regulator